MKKELMFCLLFLLIGISFVSSYPITNNDFDDSSLGLEIQTNNENVLQKIKEKCNLSEGCYIKGVCYPQGSIINLTYCFKGKFLEQRGWGDGCEYDYQCLEGFCYEEKCYRGGRDAYLKKLEDKNKELELKLQSLEDQNTLQENNSNNNLITGSAIKDNPQKQNFLTKLWNKLFRKN